MSQIASKSSHEYELARRTVMIRSRAKSPLWRMIREAGRVRNEPEARMMRIGMGVGSSRATNRFTTGFEYVGPARPDDAKKFGVV